MGKMKLKIGVIGSTSSKLSMAHKKIAYELGCTIAEKDCIPFISTLYNPLRRFSDILIDIFLFGTISKI